jgi:formylmethanofuran dehydrogenase subunit E
MIRAPLRREEPVLEKLPALLEQCASRHRRLCPRQVLGVRIGLAGGRALCLDLPREDKRLFVFVETDGCGADGIIVATGCEVGRRTLRVIDHGKVAATFVDVAEGKAVRVAPLPGIREAALDYALETASRWQAQLAAYQIMPDDRLFSIRPVRLTLSMEAILGQPNAHIPCSRCGEEIRNQREVLVDGLPLCRACAGDSYYTSE